MENTVMTTKASQFAALKREYNRAYTRVTNAKGPRQMPLALAAWKAAEAALVEFGATGHGERGTRKTWTI